MKEPKFHARVPINIFSDKRICGEPIRLLLAMFKDYFLFNSKGYTDENGNKISHRFEEVEEKDTFLMPVVILVLWDKGEISFDHYVVYAYLCYISKVKGTHMVKVKKEFVKDATGLSKTEFQKKVKELIKLEVRLVNETDKDNQVEIPWLETKFIQDSEKLSEEFLAVNNGEMDSDDANTIPTYLLKDHSKFGISFKEATIILDFAVVLSIMKKITFDEAVKFVIQRSHEQDKVDSFKVRAVIKKAEKKNILDVVKGRDGSASIIWKVVPNKI
ncbi:hypothetical protein ABEV54_05800 [Peribacillus psychrosaccharolyticus]|uniref:hypothetical protein n=1 Tax=Peribacillus psychrosaccharolyticus TaxID=1407 RepID=UPI003D2DF70D